MKLNKFELTYVLVWLLTIVSLLFFMTSRCFEGFEGFVLLCLAVIVTLLVEIWQELVKIRKRLS